MGADGSMDGWFSSKSMKQGTFVKSVFLLGKFSFCYFFMWAIWLLLFLFPLWLVNLSCWLLVLGRRI